MHVKAFVRKAGRCVVSAVMALFSLLCVFPLLWTLYSSFKTRKEFSLSVVSLPSTLSLDNYIGAIKVSNMDIFFKNSLIISVLTIVVVIAVGFITGYALSRFEFKGRTALYALFIAGMLVPVYSLLVPLFMQFKMLGMLDRRVSLIFTYAAYNMPLTIFLVEAFVRTVPKEMEEAAFLDGSSIMKTVVKIIMPMTKPVVSTAVILSFLAAWNEFPFAMILIKSKSLKTIPIGIANFSGEFSVNYVQMMAACVLATLPMIVVYLFFNKQIIEGMTAGAVKG